MKPRATWMITLLCLALLGGAMAWITRSMLRMESDQNGMANNATMQEMARLALWRMEGIASRLVVEESARPPEQYRTFSTPEALLNNKTYSTWNDSSIVALSPLVTEQPELCKLHFELDAKGAMRSPQVPVGNDLLVCQAAHALPTDVINGNEQNLAALARSIDVNDAGGKLREMQGKLRPPPSVTGNRALLWSANGGWAPSTPVSIPQAAQQVQEKPAAPNPPEPAKDKSQAKNSTQTSEMPAYAMQQRTIRTEETQAVLNSMEQKSRQDFFQGERSRATSRAMNYDNTLAKQSARVDANLANEAADAAPAAETKKAAADSVAAPVSAAPPALRTGPSRFAQKSQTPAPAQPATAKPLLPPLPEAASVKEVPASQAPSSAAAAAPATPAPSVETRLSPAVSPPAPATNAIPQITEFLPLWLGDALLLTRRVTTPERQWIQGAWVDWEKLQSELLGAVQDRFPEARVIPAPDRPEAGAHLLASLPVQLIPGSVTFPAAPFWSPLKVSLTIAWLCVLLAVAAVVLVLRGMMSLSERRASFVSSVTHELRTPLATFKLYSEMLADGLVREEQKKQQYLETLTGEADRLGHLVENVLAYSRIERGKGPTAAASVSTGDLVNRIEPRLNQRTLMAGMDFCVTSAPGTLDAPLRTDAGAVEQILCNLVDNACKYGRSDGTPGKVELVISRERRRLCFAVRDHGPGILRSEENTIFLPFHKSARDAAHSAPGVGLGLALCRRLAVELGGTLELDRAWKPGACFVLRLPV